MLEMFNCGGTGTDTVVLLSSPQSLRSGGHAKIDLHRLSAKVAKVLKARVFTFT